MKDSNVNHSYSFIDPNTGAHTNTIKRQWRELKRKVPVFGRRKKHFVGYLATVMLKMKYGDLKKRFDVFINEAVKLYPPPLP